MAEFQDVMRYWKRMCNTSLCSKCGFYDIIDGKVNKCRDLLIDNPKEAEMIVMSWAAEHTEPVYQTWVDYLKEIGLISFGEKYSVFPIEMIPCTDKMFMPITADIAEKLGIQPKEG